MSSIFTDNVTPLNKATMDQLEVAARKGAANGYAPLDATSKVPLTNLPAVSGVDYIGPWAAGTAFKRGDVVNYLGNDYLAVNDSTGVVPPAPVVPPLLGASYGTSLPASPFNGQEAILVDSLTNPSYQWRFRWNAGSSSAYKWEFIGGSPLIADNAGQTGVTSQSYISVPPAITIPRAGDYGWSLSLWLMNGTLGGLSYATPSFSIASAADAAATFYQSYAASPSYGSGSRTGRLLGLAAAAVVNPYVHVSTGTGAFQNIHLELTPVRVA